MKLPLRCGVCHSPVGTAEMPDNLRELVPIQYRALLSFLPADLTIRSTDITDALNIKCVKHSTS